jgi:acetolactate synthase-1/2/3 large subunit
MADGYSRTSGRTGICLAAAEAEIPHLISGIANAYFDSIPLVVITGKSSPAPHKRNRKIRHTEFHENDIINMVKSVTKWSCIVERLDDLPEILYKAFALAKSGRNGPVLVDIPFDIQAGLSEFKKNNFKFEPSVQNISYNKMYDFIKLIKASQSPIVVAGGGLLSSNASKEFSAFIEKTHLPVVTSLMGLGSFDMTNSLSVGCLGTFGTPWANKSINSSDLVISFGSRLDKWQLGSELPQFSESRKIVQIDIDKHSLGSKFKPTLMINCDIKLFLEKINLFIAGETFERNEEWLNIIARYRNTFSLEKEYSLVSPYEKVRPQYIIKKISELASPDDIVTADVGESQKWTALFFSYRKPHNVRHI